MRYFAIDMKAAPPNSNKYNYYWEFSIEKKKNTFLAKESIFDSL